MDYYYEAVLVLLPWFSFLFFALCAKKLLKYAHKRKGIAVAFGVLVQMFLPDPQVEKTIETVIVAEKRVDNRQTDESDE
jgi:hypothetical protein